MKYDSAPTTLTSIRATYAAAFVTDTHKHHRTVSANVILLTTDTVNHILLDPEGGSQNATQFVVVISSLKIPKAFLICSTVQRNFAHTFVLIFPTGLVFQILHLFSN